MENYIKEGKSGFDFVSVSSSSKVVNANRLQVHALAYNLSLTHTKYNCTYHIVFVPKYRRKVMYGQLKQEVGQILSIVCKITGIQLIKGGVCPDHVHMYVSIPPKMSLSSVMSKLKGKSALMIFDRYPEYRDKYGRHFWARGYYVETVRQVNEDTIMKYIEEQKESSRIEG